MIFIFVHIYIIFLENATLNILEQLFHKIFIKFSESFNHVKILNYLKALQVGFVESDLVY